VEEIQAGTAVEEEATEEEAIAVVEAMVVAEDIAEAEATGARRLIKAAEVEVMVVAKGATAVVAKEATAAKEATVAAKEVTAAKEDTKSIRYLFPTRPKNRVSWSPYLLISLSPTIPHRLLTSGPLFLACLHS